MVLFFIYDEFTDKVDGDGARVYAEMVMDAIRNLTRRVHKASQSSVRSHGSTPLPIHFAYFIDPDRDRFWLRAMKVTSPEAQRRFVTTFAEYVYAVIDEASDRANGRVRGVEDYLKLTRLTAGGYPSFLAAEAGLNIPDEVMAHPALQAILSFAAESLVLTNVGISWD
jgi:hypothetical protein